MISAQRRDGQFWQTPLVLVASGCFSQFLSSPFCVLLLDLTSWRTTLLVFGGMVLLVLPLSLLLSTTAQLRAGQKAGVPIAPARQVFRDALRSPSFVLLICGYIV